MLKINNEDYLTYKEAQQFLGVCRVTLRKFIISNKIQIRILGAGYKMKYIKKTDLVQSFNKSLAGE
jgi:hypothetical protein